MRPRVFVTQPIAASALKRLHAVADYEVNPEPNRIIAKPRLCKAVSRHDILFALAHDVVDREVLAANPNLRAVASMAVTPDNIDVAEATARRIPVTVIPPVATEARADLTFGLLLAAARRIVESDALMRSGGFPGSQSNFLAGAPVHGKTLGIVGAGRSGQAMARRAHGFGMRILYCDPRRLPDADERALGLTYLNLEQLLGQADFVSLHVPLRADTRRMIGPRQMALMKKDTFLVNTANGALVDEAALAAALAGGKLAGAGLDVFEAEPKVNAQLLGMRNVVLTPRLGSATAELRGAMANIVVDNIIALVQGREPPNCVNPEALASAPAA